MAEYYNVTTNIGDAEIANAIATNTKLNITHIAFGDGNGSVPTPNKVRTSLVREVHRQAVTKYERHATNANWIVIETIIPSNIGGFTIREMGIIANNKLISHGSHAPFEKVADPTGVSEYRLKFTQNITDGSVVEIMLDESLIYASQAWVEENFIKRSEILDNLTTDDETKPISARQAKILQDNKLEKTGNAASATKLEIARSISLTGSVTGSVDFDGSDDIIIAAVLKNFESLKSANGYKYLGDGLIFQWGTSARISDEQTIPTTFPVTFPNACLNMQLTENELSTSSSNAAHVAATGVTKAGFNLRYNSSAITSTIAFWLAIGY